MVKEQNITTQIKLTKHKTGPALTAAQSSKLHPEKSHTCKALFFPLSSKHKKNSKFEDVKDEEGLVPSSLFQ